MWTSTTATTTSIPPREVEEWVERYRRAWLTNDPADITDLFSKDALYFSEPYAQAQRGSQQIVDDWLARKDEPGNTTFTFEVLATTDDLAFVQGETVYKEPSRTYSNLWVIRFGSKGKCKELTEWWMEPK